MPILKKQDFYNTFYQKDQIPDCYESISFGSQQDIFKQSVKKTQNKAYAITLFPKYFDYKLSVKHLKINKIEQTNLDGFAINLEGCETADQYLQKNIKSKTRSPILRRIKRFESCFDVEYELFFGAIEKEIYQQAMSTLKSMLELRFSQKDDSTEILEKWHEYQQSTYNKILNKEASLFITYASGQMVAISINYHINKVFIGHIFCYDITYSKFSLGNMMVYKLLEWCCENDYLIMDMGNGDLEYKQIWCNNKYHYDYHFIHHKNSLAAIFATSVQMGIIKLKNLLKTLKIDEAYKKLRQGKSTTSHPFELFPRYKVEHMDANNDKSGLPSPITLNHPNFDFLKKPVNDFLYLNKEHYSQLKIFQIDSKNFLLMGQQNAEKIILE
ncbi:GNAT family N-acetyltransferase [Tamlana crocina]|uniref:GNAT family N-acetyltransferase n=1 Tax=Tamlana crocina TaxID=393006 RepID=A0ABX1D9W7_9FLAO|nr:GNAT family N-acetyltransferase [Tamlana crocina]NJX15173.1 GNAT family N-acetyltransferase [Tamlana crocina]